MKRISFRPTAPKPAPTSSPAPAPTLSLPIGPDVPVFADPNKKLPARRVIPPLKRTRTHEDATPGKVSVTTRYNLRRRKSPAPARQPPADSLNPTSPPVDTLKLRNDRLGTLVRTLTAAFANSPSWEDFIHDTRGPSYLATELDELNHPAAELLRYWRDHGVPANNGTARYWISTRDRDYLQYHRRNRCWQDQ